MTKPAGRLDGLQAGRAIAALMVVAFHANKYALPEQLYAGGKAASAFDMGHAGVEFFFVLSGFIMMYIHRKDFSKPSRAYEFLRRRVLRIYPFYWVVLAAYVVLCLAMPVYARVAQTPMSVLTSALLIPKWDLPSLEVAWTLRHEMLFYAVFAVLVIDLRAGLAVFTGWMALCLMSGAGYWHSHPYSFLFAPYNALFALGIGAALVAPRVERRWARIGLVAGTVLFMFVGLSQAYGIVDWSEAIEIWAFGLGAAAITVGLAAGDVAPPMTLVLLGDASYSIYLVHEPFMDGFATILARWGAPWGLPTNVLILGLVAIAAGVGYVAHAVFEKPLLDRLAQVGRFMTSRPDITKPRQSVPE